VSTGAGTPRGHAGRTRAAWGNLGRLPGHRSMDVVARIPLDLIGVADRPQVRVGARLMDHVIRVLLRQRVNGLASPIMYDFVCFFVGVVV